MLSDSGYDMFSCKLWLWYMHGFISSTAHIGILAQRVCWRRRSLVPWERAASQPSQDGGSSVQANTRDIRCKISSASSIDVTGTVVPLGDSVKLLCVTLDSVLTIDQHISEVIRSCITHASTAPHSTAADTRRRQDDRSQHCVISTGLHQRTAAWHVGLQHQQVAAGSKFIGQDSLSSPSVSQCHQVASSASLAASSTMDFLQGRCHHLQDTFHQQTGLPLWPPARLLTSPNITVIGQTVTVCTADGVSVLGESLQRQRPFSLELAVISVSICWTV